jgi:YfiH family protein
MIARLPASPVEMRKEAVWPPIVQSRILSTLPFVAHGITRRVEGLGTAEGNVGYGSPRDRQQAWEMRDAWCGAIGLDAAKIVTVNQIHGRDALVARRQDAGRGARPGSSPLGEADALISAVPGVVLMTLHADCLAILLCDPEVPVVAAVHAGWRGTVAGVTARTVQEMVRRFGADPDRTIAYLGPTNRDCCYEVGEEVIDGWLRYDPLDAAGAVTRRESRWHFDVAAANQWTLLQEGLRLVHIEASGICTECRADQWFSHRAQGPDTGRFGALIGLREH